MRNLAKNPNDPFWDDKTTKNVVETRDDIIKKSWSEAVSELESKYGSDMTKWSWGRDAHCHIPKSNAGHNRHRLD